MTSEAGRRPSRPAELPVGGLVFPIYKAHGGLAKRAEARHACEPGDDLCPDERARARGGRGHPTLRPGLRLRLPTSDRPAAAAAAPGRAPPAARSRELEVLDRGLVLWFPGPASFTGEDVLELQVHGSRAVLAGLLDGLASLPGLRSAEPGEFSKRAFLNGRLDLTAAEGLADLIAAETRAQARQALRQLDGALGRLYDDWRQRLLEALARLEAAIDFAPEEADVPADLLAVVRPGVARLATEMAAHLADRRRGERLREGLTIAVLGPPNAGKSTLVNRLAQRDVAIVTAEPGTTRDVLEVHLDSAAIPVTVLDTAGLREAVDAIEAEGVRRARQRAANADLRLLLFDGALWPRARCGDAGARRRGGAVRRQQGRSRALAAGALGRRAAGAAALLSDRRGFRAPARGPRRGRGRAPVARGRTRADPQPASGGAQAALEALERFRQAAGEAELALLAEDLRLAARALGRLTGRVGVDDVLDLIFAEFCIGK